MSNFSSCAFEPARLSDLLHLVSANATERWPCATYFLNSDVAWGLPGSDPEDNVRLWYDAGGVAAFAWFDDVVPAEFDVRHDVGYDDPLVADVLGWLERRRRDFPPVTPWLLDLRSMDDWLAARAEQRSAAPASEVFSQVRSLDLQSDRVAFLQANGYERTEHFGYHLRRRLDDPIPPCSLPSGWTIRRVEEADFEKRVQVHRDAWFQSGFSLERYLEVRDLAAFDPELDLVAVTPGGEFASYCIGWVDPASGVGSFEPVGTAAAFQRRGIGREVQYEGLRRMQAKGMHSAKIGTAGFNDPAYALYRSCGFELADRNRTFIKTLA